MLDYSWFFEVKDELERDPVGDILLAKEIVRDLCEHAESNILRLRFEEQARLNPPKRKPTTFEAAWFLFKDRVQTKTGWGKNELAALMAECLEQAVREAE